MSAPIHTASVDHGKINVREFEREDELGQVSGSTSDTPPPYDGHTFDVSLLESKLVDAKPLPAIPDDQPTSWRIVIHVVGTRGDVTPFLGIANELQKMGHKVRLATHERFRKFVQDSGVQFFPLGGDPEELMAFMAKNGGLIPSVASVAAGDITRNRNEVKALIDGAYASCGFDIALDPEAFTPDVIIANPPSFGSIHCAEALHIPFRCFSPMPWAPTSAYAHPFARVGRSQPRLNLLSYEIINQITWTGCSDLVNSLRSRLNLLRATAQSVSRVLNSPEVPHAFLYSDAVLGRPKDWGPHLASTGYCFAASKIGEKYNPPENLANFLANGSPPIYCGFGSICGVDLDLIYGKVIQAVEELQERAIVCVGWGQTTLQSSENILVIAECPHEWLFPQCSAVIHHGGAGTTAQGLRCGRPTMVMSYFGDQSFWGEIVAGSGAGPRPLVAVNATVERIALGLRQCRSDDTLVKAMSIAEKLAVENGPKAAALHLIATTSHLCTPSQLDDSQVASMIHIPTGIEMSTLEARMLCSRGLVDMKSLKRKQITSWTLADEVDGSSNWINSLAMGFYKGGDSSYRQIRAGYEGGGAQVPLGFAKGVGSLLYFPSESVFRATANVASGVHRVHRLYDPTYHPHKPVTDLKSGLIEGCKSLAVNGMGAAIDMAVKPIQMGRKDGWAGGAKGFAIGLVNGPVKLLEASLDFVTLPAKGLLRQVKTNRANGKAKHAFAHKSQDDGDSDSILNQELAKLYGCDVEFVNFILARWRQVQIDLEQVGNNNEIKHTEEQKSKDGHRHDEHEDQPVPKS